LHNTQISEKPLN